MAWLSVDETVRAVLAIGFLVIYGLGFVGTGYYGMVTQNWSNFNMVVATGVPQIVLTYYFTRSTQGATR